MTRQIYYVLKGTDPVPVAPEDFLKWGKWFETAGNRVVEQTDIAGCLVSTVFLGIDHGFGSSEPILFETMILTKTNWMKDYQERYATWDEAKKGHKKAIKWLKERLAKS